MTRKQQSHSVLKGMKATYKAQKRLLMIVMGLFLTVSFVDAAQNDFSGSSLNVFGGTSTIAVVTMASIGNIEQGNAKDAAGNQIGMRIWLISRDQIDDTVQFPLPNADREVSTIPLKAGEYMHYHDSVSESQKDNGTSERGDINNDYTNTFSYVMYGNKKQLMAFIEEYAGQGFIIIWQECGAATKYIQGSFCKPMILQSYDRKNDNEGKYITLNYQNKHWQQPCTYTGDIILQDPVTIAADAVNLAYVSDNGRYNLSVNTQATALATVSGIASADYGKTLTIYGVGGANATTIADNTVFNLVDGVTWTGNAGSSITFKILDADTLVEVGRVQTA